MTDTTHTILVVDDETDTCRNLQDILTDLGYRVDIAQDGGAALELVRRHAYDVALLDYLMPGMDGLTLYREIKKLHAGTVAIVVSAYAGGGKAEEALEAGAWHFLPKPVDFPKLLGLVVQALDQPLVLVVDDDPDLCANLWDLLRERGYRVAVAHDTRQAADQLSQAHFRVVLIDMCLPEGDGGEVYRLVRRSNPEARAVLITGHRSELEDKIELIMQEGAEAVCYKPFDVPQLLGMMSGLIRERSGRAAGREGEGDR